MFTLNIFLDFKFLFHSLCHFGQGQFYFNSQIGTTIHSASAARTTVAKTSESSEMASENIAKCREYIFDIRESAKVSTTGSTAYTSVSELIVSLSFIGVTKYFISFSSLLKFLFRFLITRIFIGVIL